MNGSGRTIRSLRFAQSGALTLVAFCLAVACSSSGEHDGGAGSGPVAGSSGSGQPSGAGGTGDSNTAGTPNLGGSPAQTGGSTAQTGGARSSDPAGGTGASSGAPAMGSGTGGGATPVSGGASGGSSRGMGGRASAGEAGRPAAGGMAPTGTPTLFWLDVSGKVERSYVAKFSPQTIVPSAGQGSDGIAVDVDAGYVYWTNMGVPADDDGSVMRSKLDGSMVTTLVPKGGTYTPKQLKLVPEQGKLYWSDREGMRVMRANVDGSQIETLYQSGSTAADRMDDSRWCVGIAVDVAGGYFYWSQKGTDDGHEGSVRRARLQMPAGDTPDQRSDVEVLFDGEAATCDIELDLDAGFIYWANRGDDSINRGPIAMPSGATATTRTDKQAIVSKVTQAIGVALDHERGIVYYTDAVGDVGRANLDGSDSKFLLTKSGAFTGIVSVDLPLTAEALAVMLPTSWTIAR